jgi:hypothetical protein
MSKQKLPEGWVWQEKNVVAVRRLGQGLMLFVQRGYDSWVYGYNLKRHLFKEAGECKTLRGAIRAAETNGLKLARVLVEALGGER